MNKIVTVETLSHYGSGTWPALEFLCMVKQAIADIPVEYRANAVAELEEGGYDVSGTLIIQYDRPETDEEVLKRKADDLKRDQDREDDLRRQYESLKRRFERAK